jgi:hypothetical protein
VIVKKSSSPDLDTYKLGAMTTPPVTMPSAPGADATGTAPSAAALAAVTTLPATPPSYVQPLMPTMGGLLQSTNGEFKLWMGGRPLYD